MILPDVNVLVHAYREATPHHDVCRDWLHATLRGPDGLAVTDHCLTGFVRIVTNARIFDDPVTTTDALAFVAAVRGSTRSHAISATSATWDLLGAWAAADPALRGNLVPDAYLAAVAVTNGAAVATLDRGFARFPGVEVVVPGR